MCSSDVLLVVLVDQCISKWTVRHSMFVHVVVLEVRHHISKSSLSSGFCPLLLNFVHLLKVLLRRWVQLGSESFLGLERASFGFGHLVHFEAAAHGRVHHYFAGSLNLLKRIQCDIV